MEKIYGVRDTRGRFYFGLFLGHQLDKAEQLAARNNLVVVELVEKCPCAWPGDDGTAADCVVNGHCGCIHGTTPNVEVRGASRLAGEASLSTAGLDLKTPDESTLVLYDGPDAVVFSITPYQRVYYPELRGSKAAKVSVSPEMLMAMRDRPLAKSQTLYTSTANLDSSSGESGCNSDRTNSRALSSTPEAPIVSRSTVFSLEKSNDSFTGLPKAGPCGSDS